jgi:DNA-binding FrmR family transcriptional regulator
MSNTTREKQKLLNRVRRIRGQMEAVERALEEEKGCTRCCSSLRACAAPLTA